MSENSAGGGAGSLLTNAGAEAYLAGGIRKALRQGLVLMAVAVLVVGALDVALTYKDLGYQSPSDLSRVSIVNRKTKNVTSFYGTLAGSTGIVALILGLFTFSSVRQRSAVANRMRPIIASGTRIEGVVSEKETTTDKSRRVPYNKLHLTVSTPDGRRFKVAIEVPGGNELPSVELQAPAAVWVAPGGVVAAAGDGLFEGASASA